MVVAMQAARRVPILRGAAAGVGIEAARDYQRGARKARLELERDRNHGLRSGAAAVQEYEQVFRFLFLRGGEAEDPTGGHAMEIVTPTPPFCKLIRVLPEVLHAKG